MHAFSHTYLLTYLHAYVHAYIHYTAVPDTTSRDSLVEVKCQLRHCHRQEIGGNSCMIFNHAAQKQIKLFVNATTGLQFNNPEPCSGCMSYEDPRVRSTSEALHPQSQAPKDNSNSTSSSLPV